MVKPAIPRIKICGITSLGDALAAVEAGCDALGFIFYPGSPRYITPAKAAVIIAALPPGILKVGVFVNAGRDAIEKTVKKCGLDAVQLHGDESAEFCAALKGYRVIKAVRVKRRPDEKALKAAKAWGFLFDAYSVSARGGTGKTFSWSKLKGLKVPGKFILSGGLGPRNVTRALNSLRPDWLDASSCLEKSPGKKDPVKMRQFVARVRNRGMKGEARRTRNQEPR